MKCVESASRSVVSNSLQPHGLQPTMLLHPWDFPGKSIGVGCHCLLCAKILQQRLKKKELKGVIVKQMLQNPDTF